jgi:hypothetical protein
MPVVPITRGRAATGATSGKGTPLAPPPEPFALMAAAQMHAEGRLVEPTGEAPSGSVPNPK